MGISLSGLASGMDTNAMVTALMKLERLPYENLNVIKTDRTQAQKVFQELNVKLLALKNAAADLNYKASFQAKSVTSSDDTVLSGNAAVNATAGTYQIEVTKLAQAHSVRTNSLVTNDSAIDPSDGKKISFHYNGKSVEIELDGLTNEDNLSKMAAMINNGGLGVRASVIESEPGSKTLVLTSKESGLGNEIEFMPADPNDAVDGKTYISADEDVLNALGLKTGDGSINQVRAAQNAEFTIDGLQVQSKTNTSRDVIAGVTLSLTKLGSSTLTIEVDGDKAVEKVETFVNAYNDVIELIRGNTAQEMALQGDSTLRSLESQLNNWFNRAVGEDDGSLRYMFQIGLEIDKGVIMTGSSMTGKISFDKDKFKEQFAANPDEVYALFGSDHPGDDRDGVAQYFGGSAMNSWTSSVNGIISTRIKGYDSEISTITDQMSQMNDRINAKEARLRKQFAAMETALSQLQSQQQWMATQLASLTSSL